MKPSFSINDYDRDGDIYQDGIFLHFGDTRIKAAETLDEFKKWPDMFKKMIDEIEENCF